MNKAGLLPLLASGLVLACPAADEQPPRKLSEHVTREIKAKLPAFVAKPPPATMGPAEAQSSDPDVLVLPNLVIVEKPPVRMDDWEMLTQKEQDRQLALVYLDSLTGLDAVLNGFTIPFLSPSPAARGRAIHKARKLEELDRFIETTKVADPKISAELKKAVVDMNRAEEWQNRLTGGK